jgi:hypothetical protein
MSYFQKYQKTTNQSKVTAHTHDTSFDENEGTADFRSIHSTIQKMQTHGNRI